MTYNSTSAPLDPPTNWSKFLVSRSTTLLAVTRPTRPNAAAVRERGSLIAGLVAVDKGKNNDSDKG